MTLGPTPRKSELPFEVALSSHSDVIGHARNQLANLASPNGPSMEGALFSERDLHQGTLNGAESFEGTSDAELAYGMNANLEGIFAGQMEEPASFEKELEILRGQDFIQTGVFEYPGIRKGQDLSLNMDPGFHEELRNNLKRSNGRFLEAKTYRFILGVEKESKDNSSHLSIRNNILPRKHYSELSKNILSRFCSYSAEELPDTFLETEETKEGDKKIRLKNKYSFMIGAGSLETIDLEGKEFHCPFSYRPVACIQDPKSGSILDIVYRLIYTDPEKTMDELLSEQESGKRPLKQPEVPSENSSKATEISAGPDPGTDMDMDMDA